MRPTHFKRVRVCGQRCLRIEEHVKFHYVKILEVFINKLKDLNLTDFNLRNAVNSALAEIILCCPTEFISVLSNLNAYFSDKIIEATTHFPTANNETFFLIEDVIYNYIVALSTSLTVVPVANPQAVINLFVAVLKSKENKAYGEIYMAISSLIDAVADSIGPIIPFITRDLDSQDIFIAQSAINCLSDCATYLEKNFREYTHLVIPSLVETIASDRTPMSFKPNVIEAFGHVALAIGKDFEPYLEMAIVLFEQISNLDRAGDEDFVDCLRKAAITFVNYVTVSLGDTPNMRNTLQPICINMQRSVEADVDNSHVDESVDLIVDLRNIFGLRVVDSQWARIFLDGISKKTLGKRRIEKGSKLYKELESN